MNRRVWVRLVAGVALLAAAWLLLVPRMVVYEAVGDRPVDITVRYAWGKEATDQTLMMARDLGATGPVDLMTSVRLHCGTVFTSGKNEERSQGGVAACSEMELPRLLGGLALLVVGVGGFVVAPRLRGISAGG